MNGQVLADVLDVGLDVVFIGINPASASADLGHSFASPGNRFWPALHASGLTATLMRPEQERDLLGLGMGITSIVRRPTSAAADLGREELINGGGDLARRLGAIRPRWAAFLGVTGYRAAYAVPGAGIGPQAARIGGARVWVLPNPSGLNALWTTPKLTDAFRAFRLVVEATAAENAATPGNDAS